MGPVFESAFFPSGKSGLELLQLFAVTALPFVSALGFSAAVWAVVENRRVQREQTARNAYIKYLELALANPWLSCPRDRDIQEFDKRCFGSASDDSTKEEMFEKYEWFLSVLLNTADFIWTSVKPDHVLSKLMELQVAYHWRYFQIYKEKKEYVALWYPLHKDKINSGIELGRKYDTEERKDWK